MANEIDELEEFLKVAPPASAAETAAVDSNQSKDIQENGNTTSREVNVTTINLVLFNNTLRKP